MTLMGLRHDLSRWAEKGKLRIAWLMPGWLVYWCAIRLMSVTTTGPYSNTVVPELTCLDALKRWDELKSL